MGRLSRHQDRVFIKKILFFGVILIVIFCFIFIYGIRLLLNFSLFVANIGSKKQPETTTQTDNFIGTVSIDSIPVATNSAKFIVSGSMQNFDKIVLYINGEEVKSDDTISSDTYQEIIGDLKKGSNEVFAEGQTTDGKHKEKTQVYNVTYISDKPKLEISSPTDHQKTNNQDFPINGKTDKEIYIRVNDLPVVVNADGSFQTSVKLKDGDNQIVISAQDVAGNTTTQTLTVNYSKDN